MNGYQQITSNVINMFICYKNVGCFCAQTRDHELELISPKWPTI